MTFFIKKTFTPKLLGGIGCPAHIRDLEVARRLPVRRFRAHTTTSDCFRTMRNMSEVPHHGVCRTFTGSCIESAFEAILTCNCCYLFVNTVSFNVTPSVWKLDAQQDPVQSLWATFLYENRVPDNCTSSRNCQIHCRMCPQTLANFGFVNVLRTEEKTKQRIVGRYFKRSQNCGQPLAGVWYLLGFLFFS